MGGGRHPDTLPFDSTHCLWSLLDHMAEVGSGGGSGGGGSSSSGVGGGHDSTNVAADTNKYTRSEMVSALWDSLRVSEIKIWAGTNLVNGVQLSYGLPLQPILPRGQHEKQTNNENNEENKTSEMNERTTRLEINSPCLSSTHDDPLPHILTLESSVRKGDGRHIIDDDDEIVEISVRAGK